MKRLFIAIPLTDTLRNHIHKFSTALHKIDLDASKFATISADEFHSKEETQTQQYEDSEDF